MKVFIEGFVSVFLMTIIIMICSSFIGAQQTISDAKDFHSSCISLIEYSDFDENIMAECQKNAEDRGYTLSISDTYELKYKCKSCGNIFSKDNDIAEEDLVCTNCNKSDLDTYIKDRICMVSLQYTIKINILNINREGVFNGYAR